MLNQPSLAILIDCWRPELVRFTHNESGKIIDNICNFCSTNTWVESVALSTYGNDQMSSDHFWQSNSKQVFCDEVRWNLLRKMWNDMQWTEKSMTHPTILSMPNNNHQFRFTAFNSLQILYYCNVVHPGIRNIYICGFSWDICVKDRPTGWKEIAAMMSANMFTHRPNLLVETSCIGTIDGVLDSSYMDHTIWSPVSSTVYKLNLENAGVWD